MSVLHLFTLSPLCNFLKSSLNINLIKKYKNYGNNTVVIHFPYKWCTDILNININIDTDIYHWNYLFLQKILDDDFEFQTLFWMTWYAMKMII